MMKKTSILTNSLLKQGKEEKKSFHIFNSLGVIQPKHIFFSRLWRDVFIIILFHVLNTGVDRQNKGLLHNLIGK